MKHYHLYIDGQQVESTSRSTFESDNPYTGKAWATISRGNASDVDIAVQAAHQAFTGGPWPAMTASQRGQLLVKVGDLIAREARNLAQIEVTDNGKLFSEMQGQLNYIPQWFYYYGGLADKIEGSVIPIDKKGYFTFTR